MLELSSSLNRNFRTPLSIKSLLETGNEFRIYGTMLSLKGLDMSRSIAVDDLLYGFIWSGVLLVAYFALDVSFEIGAIVSIAIHYCVFLSDKDGPGARVFNRLGSGVSNFTTELRGHHTPKYCRGVRASSTGRAAHRLAI
jgi:hypothetical protein